MSKQKSKFLSWFAIVYVATVLVYMSIGSYHKHPIISSSVIFAGSTVFTYGTLCLYRDLKLFGWKWIIQTFKDAFK